MMQLTGYNILC